MQKRQRPFKVYGRLIHWVLHQSEAVVKRSAVAVASVAAGSAIASVWGAQSPAQSNVTETLPVGTKVELAVTNPVWAKTAKAGDPLYMQTVFPVAAGDRVGIPAGTYVEGTIESVTQPTRKGRAEIDVLFNKIIYSDGYVVMLPGGTAANGASASTAAKLTIQVSRANDLLLDNGAQVEMTLATPVALDAERVSAAISLTQAPQPGRFKSATQCRPTPGFPGSPGTPDTVIPGSPGTPSTTIPGGPGMPDTVIPGTPATPDTVIPGSPATPDTPGAMCPPAPLVVSSEPITPALPQTQIAAPNSN